MDHGREKYADVTGTGATQTNDGLKGARRPRRRVDSRYLVHVACCREQGEDRVTSGVGVANGDNCLVG